MTDVTDFRRSSRCAQTYSSSCYRAAIAQTYAEYRVFGLQYGAPQVSRLGDRLLFLLPAAEATSLFVSLEIGNNPTSTAGAT